MKKFLLFVILVACFGNIRAQELIIKKGEAGLYLEHTVAPKEGLYALGRLYNINPKSIAAYNNIGLNQGISIGQVLRIPLTDTNFTQRSVSGTPVYYEVAAGDGLMKVSNEHNKVTLKNLREWNSLTSDNLQAGSKLVVGFLNSKEMTAQRANNLAKRTDPAIAKQTTDTKPAENKTQQTASPVKNDPVVTAKPETATVKKTDNPPPSIPAVVKEDIRPAATENGYFKTSFDQQVKAKPASKNSTVTSGIFKTTSGWQDAKYYLLMDGVTPGTIIKITNPDNNKAVYAKVLGEMNGIRQNQGLDIRISNAAASALQIADEDRNMASCYTGSLKNISRPG